MFKYLLDKKKPGGHAHPCHSPWNPIHVVNYSSSKICLVLIILYLIFEKIGKN